MSGNAKRFTKNVLSSVCGIAVAAVLIEVPHVSAQVLDEIVVTAQRREQSLQDVGVSVTAFGGDQIQKLGYTNTIDIASQTPGLMFSDVVGSGWNALPAIRGVTQNSFDPHHEHPNAIYVDDAYISFIGASSSQMFDIDRVEVLRGPQGTLFGRNATGGLMHFVSRKPTEDFEAYTDLTVGEYNLVKFEGAVSGPLTDNVLGRLSIATNQHDGYQENRVGKDDLGNDNTWNARGQVLFNVTDDLEVLISLFGGGLFKKNRSSVFEHQAIYPDPNNQNLGTLVPSDVDIWGTCPGCDMVGYRDDDGNPFKGSYNDHRGYMDRDTKGMTGRVTWEVNDVTVTSITNYTTFEQYYDNDADSTPVDFATFFTYADQEQFTQELRLNGEKERIHWVAGAYYIKTEGDFQSGFNLPIFKGTPAGFGTVNDFSTEMESWAVFGQIEYDITPEWTFIAGLRWTEQETEHEFFSTETDNGTSGLGTFVEFSEASVGNLSKQNNEDYTYKFELDWKPNNDWLVYGSVTRGTKGPGFNAPLAGFFGAALSDPSLLESLPFEGEALTSYEVGFKSTLLEGRARLNASVFYYDYKDFQAFTYDAIEAFMFNTDASNQGAEAELILQPWDSWEFSLGISLLDAEVKDVELPLGEVVDREPAQAPEYTVNGLLRKTWPLYAGELALQLDITYTDDYQAGLSNAPITAIPDSWISNGRLSYSSEDDVWEVALFARNITNEENETFNYDISALGYSIRSFSPPRWVGAQFRYNWQ